MEEKTSKVIKGKTSECYLMDTIEVVQSKANQKEPVRKRSLVSGLKAHHRKKAMKILYFLIVSGLVVNLIVFGIRTTLINNQLQELSKDVVKIYIEVQNLHVGISSIKENGQIMNSVNYLYTINFTAIDKIIELGTDEERTLVYRTLKANSNYSINRNDSEFLRRFAVSLYYQAMFIGDSEVQQALKRKFLIEANETIRRAWNLNKSNGVILKWFALFLK